MAASAQSALGVIRSALSEIIAEAPAAEPTYPRDGTRKMAEAWAYEAARWNSAQTAIPAHGALTVVETTLDKAREALKAVRDACRDPDTDTALSSAVGEEVEAALALMGERS